MKKRFLALLMSVVMMLGVMPTAFAADEVTVNDSQVATAVEASSGSIGKNVKWSLKNGVLTISGTGDMYDYTSKKKPWNPQKVTSIVIKNGVTSVGGMMFSSHEKLKKVKLPSSLKRIDYAGFLNCPKLKKITIPKNVKKIDDFAFGFAGSLKTITFKGNAPKISSDAFASDPDLDEVVATAYYPKNNKTWTSKKLKNYGGKLTWKAK